MSSYTAEALRAFGSQRVLVRTSDGTFTGRLPPDISARAAIVMLQLDGEPRASLCIHVDHIEDVALAGS